MTGALERIRVLDFTTTIAGPHCTRLLADLGAEVIKIEAPEGDMMRTRPPLRNGASTSFGQLNAGKKSIALDLKTPPAVEAVRRLVATADVVVENFRPGVMRRFGLDYEALAPIKPELIARRIAEIKEHVSTWRRPNIEAALEYEQANANRKGAIAVLESALAAKEEH